MGTKDWTATKLVECLSDNLPLTDEQRAILITLVVERARDADRCLACYKKDAATPCVRLINALQYTHRQRNWSRNMNFQVNQIVNGQRAGAFVILGFRTIGGEQYAQLKEVHPVTHQPARGELTLPLTAIKAAA